MNATTSPPTWFRPLLLVAGAYNLLWGAWTIVFPNALFHWLEMPAPNYPQLWQCIGMIVGVYGLGYAIAANDPDRHWPIVLVGLLGKVFGPIGMVQAIFNGDFPVKFAITCVTNDIIWWVPFALILKHAWDQAWAANSADSPLDLPSEETLLREAVTSTGQSLSALSDKKPVLLVFLRHSGCTFCREALADIAGRRQEIESQGVGLAFIHMGTPESFVEFSKAYGLQDVPAVADPSQRLYRGLGLRRGSLGQLLGWKVWVRGARAFFAGHSIGKFEGDVTQLPGTFLIHQGHVIRRFLAETSADRPDYVEFCELAPQPKS